MSQLTRQRIIFCSLNQELSTIANAWFGWLVSACVRVNSLSVCVYVCVYVSVFIETWKLPSLFVQICILLLLLPLLLPLRCCCYCCWDYYYIQLFASPFFFVVVLSLVLWKCAWVRMYVYVIFIIMWQKNPKAFEYEELR